MFTSQCTRVRAYVRAHVSARVLVPCACDAPAATRAPGVDTTLLRGTRGRESPRAALRRVFLFSQSSPLVCLVPTSHRPKQLPGGFGQELARVTSGLCKVLLQFLFLPTRMKRIVHHYSSLADTNHMPRQILGEVR